MQIRHTIPLVFLSTPSARRATIKPPTGSGRREHFYPRPPRGERHRQRAAHPTQLSISIHALREESDAYCGNTSSISWEFLSTPSARRATPACLHRRLHMPISIHALREESDPMPAFFRLRLCYFYPRPPRGERRGQCIGCRIRQRISIHALREESDKEIGKNIADRADFYPRPPRGERRIVSAFFRLVQKNFYPRPPRGERRLVY